MVFMGGQVSRWSLYVWHQVSFNNVLKCCVFQIHCFMESREFSSGMWEQFYIFLTTCVLINRSQGPGRYRWETCLSWGCIESLLGHPSYCPEPCQEYPWMQSREESLSTSHVAQKVNKHSEKLEVRSGTELGKGGLGQWTGGKKTILQLVY